METTQALEEDAEFRLLYMVPNLEDMELDSLDVGNAPGLDKGPMRFILEAPAPDLSKVPVKSLLDVAGITLEANYRGQTFCHVGYHVRHEYTDPALQDDPPENPELSKLRRVISADPQVTKHVISSWDAPKESPPFWESTGEVEPAGDPASFWSRLGRHHLSDTVGADFGSEVVQEKEDQEDEEIRAPSAKRARAEGGSEETVPEGS